MECGAGKALYTDFYCDAIAKWVHQLFDCHVFSHATSNEDVASIVRRLDFKADYNRWKKRMSSIAARYNIADSNLNEE